MTPPNRPMTARTVTTVPRLFSCLYLDHRGKQPTPLPTSCARVPVKTVHKKKLQPRRSAVLSRHDCSARFPFPFQASSIPFDGLIYDSDRNRPAKNLLPRGLTKA